ncbi:MAG TPA: hypothetical protein VH502_05330 [Actinoplanes sp.]
MRQAYAHDAVVTMAPDGDSRAPGGAITVALCGRIDHEPPCPVAPHHTAAERDGDAVRLRILFATEPARVAEVRSGIDSALRAGTYDGPDGVTTTWQLRESAPAPVRTEERDHAERLSR